MTERHISEASLLEISVVARGANPNTEASMREAELLAEIRALREAMGEHEDTVEIETNMADVMRALAQREYRIPVDTALAQLRLRK